MVSVAYTIILYRRNFQHDKLQFTTVDFWMFLSGPIVLSFLFTWIYNNNQRSTLSAILFHFMTNISGELILLTTEGRIISIVLITIVVALVVSIYGPEKLTKHKEKPKLMKEEKEKKEIIQRFFGKGVCPYQLSFVLDCSIRKLILSPKKLADRLHLKEDYKVLEVGCGSGFFSVEVAKRLSKGQLQLLDIQKEMLEKARKKIEKKGLTNVTFTLGEATNMPFENSEFDIVFMVAVLGEVPDKEKCIKDCYRVLKTGGTLSITEQPGDPDFVPFEEIFQLTKTAGFEFIEKFGRKKNFTANFRKI